MKYISLIGFDTHKIKKIKSFPFFLGSIFKKLKLFKSEYPGLYIGGVLVTQKYRFIANSDGDILIHSIIDALAPYFLNKDIGQLFPDNNDMYKNYSSVFLLTEFLKKIDVEYKIISIDIVIVIDKVKIAPIKEKIIENLQKFFPEAKIILKGKRTEGGFNKNYAYCWVSCTIECV